MKLHNIRSSELVRNTSMLISGTALAQLIPILLQPILRRYYTPEIFGAYAVYLSLVGILIIISSFKYELAIILPRKNKEALNIVLLAQLLNFIFNLVVFCLIVAFKYRILKLLNLSTEYLMFLYLVPLGTFLYNLYISINYWLIRQKAFFSVSLNKFVRRGSEGSFQILFKWTGVTGGLLLGDIIGHIADNISGLIQAARKNFRISDFSINKLKYVAKKYGEYPRYNLVPSFMSACSFLLPMIFINKFFSTENAGYFDLSKLLLSLPFALIATSISNVLLQRISEKFRNTISFKKELSSMFLVVLTIAVIEVIVISLFGVDLFRIIFGMKWIISGEISTILVWSYAFNFITSSFSSIFISMKKIKLLSIWQLIYFISILSLILFRNSGFMSFLKIYVFIEIMCYFLISLLMLGIVVNYESKLKHRNL